MLKKKTVRIKIRSRMLDTQMFIKKSDFHVENTNSNVENTKFPVKKNNSIKNTKFPANFFFIENTKYPVKNILLKIRNFLLKKFY